MRNIIRADLYRIFKGKGVYVAIATFIAYLILLVGSSGMGTIGVDVSSIQNPDDVTMVEVADGVEVAIRDFTPTKVTGRIAPKALADGVSDLIYFFLPFIVIIVAADFSTGTVKNLLAGGLSRTKYFMSKMILIGIICVIIVLMFLIFSIGISTIINGFGGSFDSELLKEIAKIYLPQTYLLFAYACIGLFLAFTFRSKAALISIYLAFSLVPTIIIFILQTANEKFVELIQYDLVFNIKTFAFPDGAYPPDLTRAAIMGAIFILGCAIGGMLLFKKAEIK